MTPDQNTTIDELKLRVRAFCEDRDWDQFHNPKDLAIGIATEASELLQHFRFQSSEDLEQLLGDPTRRREIQDEVADVLIFLLRFAQRFGFDLATAVAEKLAANDRRYPVDRSRGSNRKVSAADS